MNSYLQLKKSEKILLIRQIEFHHKEAVQCTETVQIQPLEANLVLIQEIYALWCHLAKYWLIYILLHCDKESLAKDSLSQ